MENEKVAAFARKNKGKSIKHLYFGETFTGKIVGYEADMDLIIIRFSKKEKIKGWNWVPGIKGDRLVFKRFNFNNYTFWYLSIDLILQSNPELNESNS